MTFIDLESIRLELAAQGHDVDVGQLDSLLQDLGLKPAGDPATERQPDYFAALAPPMTMRRGRGRNVGSAGPGGAAAAELGDLVQRMARLEVGLKTLCLFRAYPDVCNGYICVDGYIRKQLSVICSDKV
jgi:hypothetical protein